MKNSERLQVVVPPQVKECLEQEVRDGISMSVSDAARKKLEAGCQQKH